ncbi:cytochrome P450 2J6-like isoform X2 [Branchiostoma floridae]|uniref:Cytochrome P450 2J6-like isoform X2 n=1 Tax=Branchiostoma floridae TaxID=7739 RepID=A0A9J7N7J7_BRAFL|nr:cytochrome P450 2J6-like isoform X2 [Branchiostoma floridae]
MSLIYDIPGLLDFSTLLLGIVVFLMTYAYVTRPKNLPPGPWSLPIVGNLPTLILAKGKIHHTFGEWRKKYGAIVFFKIGTLNAVCLNDYDVIREAYVRRSDMFGNRPTNLRVVNELFDQKGILSASLSPQWQERRKFVRGGLGFGNRGIEDKVLEEALNMQTELLKTKSKSFNIRRMLQQAVTNVLCSMLFGKRWDYESQTFQDLMESLDVVFHRSSIFFVQENVFPYVPWFLKRGDKKKARLERILEHVRAEIKEHKETFNRDDIRDFIDAFLLEMLNRPDTCTDPDDGAFTDRHLEITVLDLFLAGTETVSTALWWACLLLILNPDIQHKVQEEIEEVIGREGRPTMALRTQMPYTTATVTEIQRYRSASTIGIPHAVPRDTDFYGYTIPKDTLVFGGQWQVHHDPELFPDPEKFNPGRFIDSDGKFKKDEHMMPFSMGPRTCVGKPLADVEVFLLLTFLFQRFNFELPEGARTPSDEGIMGISQAPAPYELVAIPRD